MEFVPGEKQFSSPEEEIAYLREHIARVEAERSENTKEDVAERVDTAREVLRTYQEAKSEDVLTQENVLAQEEADAIVLDLEPEEHDEKMNELLGIMMEKGIKNTLSVVSKMNNPHVEDDFHRFLVQYLKAGHDISGLREDSDLDRSLKMTLFEVVLPPSSEESKQKNLKELVSAMEQFYAGLLAREEKNDTRYFTIELAVQQVGAGVSIYCGIPNDRHELFEKQLLSIFPDARITEIKDDYNVHNEEGVSVGSYATFGKKYIYPIKIYEEFDQDPLSVLLNAFSKLAEIGEGAAVQFVIRPEKKAYLSKYRNAIKEIEDGKKVNEAIDIPFTLGREFLQAAKSFVADTKKKDDEEKMSQPSELSKIAIEQIKEKISSPIIAANIRLLASAPTESRAEDILHMVEASFNQFENSQGNKIAFKEVKKSDKADFFKDVAFRMYRDSEEVPLNLTELTTLVHFPVRDVKGAREIKQTQGVTAPAPLDMPKEGIVLGVNKHRGQEVEVRMAPEDRLRHLYTIGQTGTGKSVLLTNMILQDIKNGDGCCFIDPHGSDVQYILGNIPPERYEDVIYFDPSNTERPMGLNMLEYDASKPEQKTFVVNELLSIFKKLYGHVPESMGPAFEQYFRNATMLVLEHPESGMTMLDISRVLADENFRNKKLAHSTNPVVNQFWNEIATKAQGEASLQNIVPYITNKFDVFTANDIMRPIIAQQRSSFNFRKVMDERKILLVNLSKGRLGDINAHLLGLIIVGKILMSALSRVDSLGKDLPPFYLYIDEFQNVTTDSISVILSEARKYKLSLNMAHQFIAQLDESIQDAVFGNVGSILTFRINSEDAELLEKQLKPTFEARDIMNIPNFNAYMKLLVSGVPAKPFSAETLPPPEGRSEQIHDLAELSYLKYGRARAEVEREIKERYHTVETHDSSPFNV